MEASARLRNGTRTRRYDGVDYNYVRMSIISSVVNKKHHLADRQQGRQDHRSRPGGADQDNRAWRVHIRNLHSRRSSHGFFRILLDRGTDKSLPLPDSYTCAAYGDFPKRFRASQWLQFQLPTLTQGEFTQNVDKKRPIAIQHGKNLHRGIDSTVFEASVDRNYFHPQGALRGPNSPDEMSELVVVKIVKKKTHQARERNFAQHVQSAGVAHPHITTSFTGFEFRGNYHLISERADMNLRDVIKAENYSHLTGIQMLGRDWLARQLIGLAKALKIIHGPTDGFTAYHHDIKAENILVFGASRNQKFTDWGLSEVRVHSRRESFRGNTSGISPEYPQKRHVLNTTSSQPHDIWSLASVFLEILLWFHGGRSAYAGLRGPTLESKTHCSFEEIKRKWYERGSSASDRRYRLSPIVDTNLIQVASISPKMKRFVDILRELLEILPPKRYMATKVVEELEKIT
jgi:serine/threonine protein kinase